jgi:hypothetical protein
VLYGLKGVENCAMFGTIGIYSKWYIFYMLNYGNICQGLVRKGGTGLDSFGLFWIVLNRFG